MGINSYGDSTQEELRAIFRSRLENRVLELCLSLFLYSFPVKLHGDVLPAFLAVLGIQPSTHAFLLPT